ncbi:MAG: hypothetical protein ABI690_30005 [Chloroflexota bacterium]
MMGKKPQKSKFQAYWPVLGALLIVAAAVMAFFIGPAVVNWLSSTHAIKGFPPKGIPIANVYWILRGIVFVILGLLASMVVAAAAPKKKSTVTEVGLTKERKAMVNEKKARKMRQQMMNKENKRQ